jgi:hypothetical protein
MYATPSLDHCRTLLASLELECRRAAAKGLEPNPERLAALLEAALDDLQHRNLLILFLAGYLARSTSGVVPKYQHFDPRK